MRYRGYYTVARRYEFYVRVARTMSHLFAALTREIILLFLPRERKVHIFELTWNVFLLFKYTDDGAFDDFPKIFQNCSKGQTNILKHFLRISESFWRCPKISEDCQRLSRKTQRCFNDTLTKLSTNLISVKLSTSSHVRISYHFYQFITTRDKTDFYIIKVYIFR